MGDFISGIVEWFGGLTDWVGGLTGGSAFFVIAIIGAVLLLLALFFDSVFDFADGPFSLTGIGAFLGAFGFSALIANSLGTPSSISALIGGVVGILSWIGAWQLVKLLKGKDPDSISTQNYVGVSGVLTTAIREAGVGEVVINFRGEQVHLAAYSTVEIPRHSEVIVTGIRSSGGVTVAKKETE